MILIGPVPPSVEVGIHLNDPKRPGTIKKQNEETPEHEEEFDDIFQECLRVLAAKEKGI